MTHVPLPRRVMIDTGVFLRWIDNQKDAEAPACFEVVEQVLNDGGIVLFAAPSVAEVLRWGQASSIPHRRGFVVVGFDDSAARDLAKRLPLSAQQEVQAESASSLTHIKYDAMIVACAIRHKAALHIALDDDHHRLCARAVFPAARPRDLVRPAAPAIPPAPPQLAMAYPKPT